MGRSISASRQISVTRILSRGFCLQPAEWIEEDLQELSQSDPHAKTIQLLSANPLALSYEKLVLFPGTPLLDEAERGKFTPLSEKEMLIELKTFVENLTCDCTFITHHTVSGKNLTGPDFLRRKESIVAALDHEIQHGNLDMMAAIRRNKRTL